MSDLGWPLRGFYNFLGLDLPGSANDAARSVELAEAGIDPRTGGAVAVWTNALLTGRDGTTHIKTRYWYMLPSGKQVVQDLFDIELEQEASTALAADGSPVQVPTLISRAVWVLGNPVYEAGDESDLGQEESSRATAQGAIGNLSRVMMAVGEVNRQLRQGKLPPVAKILNECAVHDAAGHRLTVTGQSPKGGFDFDAVDAHQLKIDVPLAVPEVVARALTGFGVNSLDAHQKLHAEPRQGGDPRTGAVFRTEVQAHDVTDPNISIAITPTSLPAATDSFSPDKPIPGIPSLTHVAWKSDGEHRATLNALTLLGEDVKGESHLTRMRALGVNNRILHDLRNREYPFAMDHLVEYDLHDRIHELTPPTPLAEGGRLSMISLGGNNMEEIAEGFGETIGGNSKVIVHEGLDKDGKLNRIGVIIDLGLHLSPKDEANVSATADIIEPLKYCDHILLTHRHLDHVDGIFPYIQFGYLRGKTIHATPEVIRSIRDKLRTYPSIHQDDLPTFSPLRGEGWLHIQDAQGRTRLSVNYSRNATPHSARATPFFVHGHYEGKWLGSYLNPGDARYGRHNADDYDGPPVDADHLDRKFFTESNRRFLKEMERIDPPVAARFDADIADQGPTYFDMDITSILRKGWAPTEHEVEDNLSELSDWFKDKGMLLAMISTNDNRYETALRVATRVHRDVTEFGTNLQKTATTMNVLGVNDLRHAPEPRNNTQPYLDQHFEQRLQKKIGKHKANWEQTTSERTKRSLTKKIERHEARLEAFQLLKAMPNAFERYQARDAMEADLERRFGRQVTLGSLDEDQLTLGALRVGRTSKTSRGIMSMEGTEITPGPDGRRLGLLTGTQGTNVEVDAALSALAEGRHPVLDGNPKSSHTARPIEPKNNVVVISQSAIPGNDRKQDELVRKLVARDFCVVQSIHDGFKIHHIDEARRENITAALKKLGKQYTVGEDGALTISGMPTHAGGHGQEKDCRAWVKLVGADITAPQHSSDPQGVKRQIELCKAEGQRSMGRIVPNFEGIAIRAGESPEASQATSIGRTLASLIKIETVRQQRKYHSGHIKATRIVRHDTQGGFRSDGLRASARVGGVYETAFATIDAEESARGLSSRTTSRPEPVAENRMAPPPERLDRGPILPSTGFRHRLFPQQTPRQPAVLARG